MPDFMPEVGVRVKIYGQKAAKISEILARTFCSEAVRFAGRDRPGKSSIQKSANTLLCAPFASRFRPIDLSQTHMAV